MLAIKNLEFQYSQDKKFIFNFTAQAGKIKLITGASGTGKTTLLNLIAGLLQPDAGEIIHLDKDISKLASWNRQVAILFQAENLFAHLNVWQNVALGIETNLRRAKKHTEKILHILAQVGLDATYAKKLPAQLSGGQKQRVALARCLISESKILLLDEPFNGLDKKLRQDFTHKLSKIVAEKNLICLFVSHHSEEMPNSLEEYRVS